MSEKNLYAIMLVAADQPGIVAGVTKVMYEKDFNIEDSSSTLLEGFFAAIFIASHEENFSREQVREMFADFESEKDAKLRVAKVQGEKGDMDGEHYIVSIYGSDKPGIVNKVASYLSDEKINIIDLQTKVAGKKGSPIYIMVLEVVVPEGMEEENWSAKLKEISNELGTDIHIRQIETYEL